MQWLRPDRTIDRRTIHVAAMGLSKYSAVPQIDRSSVHEAISTESLADLNCRLPKAKFFSPSHDSNPVIREYLRYYPTADEMDFATINCMPSRHTKHDSALEDHSGLHPKSMMHMSQHSEDWQYRAIAEALYKWHTDTLDRGRKVSNLLIIMVCRGGIHKSVAMQELLLGCSNFVSAKMSATLQQAGHRHTPRCGRDCEECSPSSGNLFQDRQYAIRMFERNLSEAWEDVQYSTERTVVVD